MSGIALLLNVAGTLDGSTSVSAPNPLPTPVDGVHQIAVAGNLGNFNLLIGSDAQAPVGYWIRALALESAAAVRAVRIRTTVPGAAGPQPALVVAGSGAAPLVRIDDFPLVDSGSPTALAVPQYSGRWLPAGARLNFLNDSVGQAFGGVPVAGPHRVYLELEPIDTVEKALKFMRVRQAAASQIQAQQVDLASFQAAAATLSTDVPVPSVASRLIGIKVALGAAPAAGESMTIGISRVRGGVVTTLLTGSIVLNNVSPLANTLTDFSASINLGVAQLDPTQDSVRITRTYVAGGGPTPMTNTNIDLVFAP